MTNKQQIIEYLKKNINDYYCDDCLSLTCGISPRQTVYQVCTQLSKESKVLRSKDVCRHCGGIKLVNSYYEINQNVITDKISTTPKPAPNIIKDIDSNDVDSLEETFKEFFRYVFINRIDIYNEFSLQHELGLFLRNYYSNIYKVDFERNLGHFGIGKDITIKKEIDICLIDKHTDEKVGIELKYPTNGQYPEQMYAFCKDIRFLEQLVPNGFTSGYFIALVDSDIYINDRGISDNRIYTIFRINKLINGVIRKPTGERNESVEIKGSYKLEWYKTLNNKYFLIVKVSK